MTTSSQWPTTTAPGWYADNVTPGVLRWFDGRDWTVHTAPVPGSVGQAPSYAGQPAGYHYGGYPSAGQQAPEQYGPNNALHWIDPVWRSWQSVTAGYVGLAALFFWILGPVAIVLGVLALQQARAGGHGRGRAIFALVTGVIASLLGLFFLLNRMV
jgi:hypothetical protein